MLLWMCKNTFGSDLEYIFDLEYLKMLLTQNVSKKYAFDPECVNMALIWNM